MLFSNSDFRGVGGGGGGGILITDKPSNRKISPRLRRARLCVEMFMSLRSLKGGLAIPYIWDVNIGLGNGLVLLGNKPLMNAI